jgi:hypothetical protein
MVLVLDQVTLLNLSIDWVIFVIEDANFHFSFTLF